MSTPENTENFVAPDTDDLDAFEKLLHGHAKPPESEPEETAISDKEEDQDDQDADALEQNDDDTHVEDDTLADDEDDNEDEPEEKPAKPKSRFQERIDDLVGKQRDAERRLADALAEIEKLKQNTPEPKPTPQVKQAENEPVGPSPDDVNEDGTEKYPLGEFDPKYIKDLTRFTIAQEQEAIKAKEKEQALQQEIEREKAELAQSWSEKVGPAQERYPDFQEKGEALVSVFEGIDQNYGEYLSATLMSMEFGPDVLYYLANNVDEATKIVNSGPTKATIALGRLEARFAEANAEKQIAKPRVSKAPTPPPHVNKGSAVSVPEIPDDTDDLDAFAEKLFKKKRRG